MHPSFIILTRAYRSTVPEMTTECSLVFVVVRLAKKNASTSHLAYPAKNIIGQIRKKIARVRFLMFADKREELGGSSGGDGAELNWKIGELGGTRKNRSRGLIVGT